MPSTVQANLWKLYLLHGLAFTWFPIPTIVLFYQSHGLSLEQALVLKTVLSVSTLVFEIPSGYLADVTGRKVSLVAGGVIWTLSLLAYSLSQSFSLFLVAEILAGLAASLISGADTALAYDTLVQLEREGEYQRFEGKLVAIAGVTEAVCGAIGALIAANQLVYPFYLQTACIAAYSLLAATLVEPTRHRLTPQPERLKALGRTVRWSLEEPRLKWLIFFSATSATATFLIVWLSQAYLNLRGLPTAMFGVAWAFFHGVMSLAALGSSWFASQLGKRAFLSLVLLLGISYILLAVVQQGWGIIFIGAIYVVRGLRTPLVLSYLNRYVASDIRATVLSVNSFVFRVGFAIAGPLAGWLADAYSLEVALIICGLIFLILGGLCLRRLEVKQVI